MTPFTKKRCRNGYRSMMGTVEMTISAYLMTVAADTETPSRMTAVTGTVIRKDVFPVRRVATFPVSPVRVRALLIGVAILTTLLS